MEFPDDASINLSLFSGTWLETPLKGEGHLFLSPEPHYDASIQNNPLPIPQILVVMEWDKKILVNGKISGQLKLEGNFSKLTKLEGLWKNDSDGSLLIADPTLLDRLAAASKQPIEIIKASFEKYHYNEGLLTLGLVQENIRLAIQLNGEAGKRDLEVNLHDLF